MTMVHDHPAPLLYLITDRRRAGSTAEPTVASLATFLRSAAAAGVDMIQIRERDLPGGELFKLTKTVFESAEPYGAEVFVNDRADIAAAVPGVGVHLTTRSIPAAAVRAAFGERLKIGVSTHSLQEAMTAESSGADFVVFGPLFETESKKQYGPAVGIAALREVVSRVRIPVLALGGINMSNFNEALGAGAAGIAGISIFADAGDIAAVVRRIKAGKE